MRAPASRTSFLAVRVGEPALSEVAQLLRALAGRIPGVRWVRPEGVHVTVAFLGPATIAVQQATLAAATAALTGIRGGPIELQGIGAFPDTARARVLWLGVDAPGTMLLSRLAAECRVALAAAALPFEERAYTAHCTLGRPRARWNAVQASALSGVEVPALPAFEAREVTLLESHPAPGGSRYADVGIIPLAPPESAPGGAVQRDKA